jgi:hypothetical protein
MILENFFLKLTTRSEPEISEIRLFSSLKAPMNKSEKLFRNGMMSAIGMIVPAVVKVSGGSLGLRGENSFGVKGGIEI